MAYCLRCGAYIPDGQTACLACGYDPDAERKAAEAEAAKRRESAAAAAQQQKTEDYNEDIRRRMEEQRRHSQEQNRQWAEQEKKRRDEQAAREEARRQQQEADRQWAKQEYQRRQAEQRARTADNPYYDNRVQTDGSTSAEGNKALAALSYLSVLFAIPYVFTPKDRFAKFHAKQGLKLFIFGILCDAVGALTGLGWILTLLRLYLIYKGMMNALNGKWETLPWIGKLGEE